MTKHNRNQIAFASRAEALTSWVEALESGKKRQIQGSLKEHVPAGDRYGFCCLGVVCDLNAKAGGAKWEGKTSYMDDEKNLPKPLQNFLGLSDKDTSNLISMNDDDGSTFKQIAKYIRNKVMPKALARSASYRAR